MEARLRLDSNFEFCGLILYEKKKTELVCFWSVVEKNWVVIVKKLITNESLK